MFNDYEMRRWDRPSRYEASVMRGNAGRQSLYYLARGSFQKIARVLAPYAKSAFWGGWNALPLQRIFPDNEEYEEEEEGTSGNKMFKTALGQGIRQSGWNDGPSYIPPFPEDYGSANKSRTTRKYIDSVVLPVNFLYIGTTSFDFTFAPNATYLNLCKTGTKPQNRVGRIMNIKSLRLRLDFNMNGAANIAVPKITVRALLVCDHQPSATSRPTLADVLKEYDAQSFQQSFVLSFPNPDNSERFTIVRDVIIQLPFYTRGAGTLITNMGTEPTFHQIYHKFRPYLRTTYLNDNVDDLGFSNGALFLVLLANPVSTDGVTGNPISQWTCDVHTRIKFEDA